MSTISTTPTSERIERKVTRGDFGRNQFLDPKRIKVDKRYQRPQTPIVSRIVNEFDEKLFEPLTISERKWVNSRGDKYYAVDGGNRLTAALRLGLKEVPVRIVPTESEQEEARLFTRINSERQAVGFASSHRASVFAGDPTATAIEKAMNAVGFTLIRDKADEKTQLLKISSPVYYVFKLGNQSGWAVPGYEDTPLFLDGTLLLQHTLELIEKTWGAKKKVQAWNGNTVKALAIFLEKFWEHISLSDVRKLMNEYSSGDMATEAASMTGAVNNFNHRAIALARAYNRSTGQRLRYQAAFPSLFND